jgi:hypothetical protein
MRLLKNHRYQKIPWEAASSRKKIMLESAQTTILTCSFRIAMNKKSFVLSNF